MRQANEIDLIAEFGPPGPRTPWKLDGRTVIKKLGREYIELRRPTDD